MILLLASIRDTLFRLVTTYNTLLLLVRFCTAWPAGLDTEEDVEEHFPITLTYSDYLNSSSSVRDRRSRIVQIRINIKALPLDDHARDKLIRLVGERYNEETGEILLVSDRCPYRHGSIFFQEILALHRLI